MNVLGCDVLLISSYSLGKADVNYRAGSKLPDSSVRKVVSLAMLNLGDAHSLVEHAKRDETVSNLISQISWHRESHPGPPHYHCDALPTEPCQHICSVRSESHQMRFSVRRKKNITIAPGPWQVRNRN